MALTMMRSLVVTSRRGLSSFSGVRRMSSNKMQQVDVEEAAVQEKLGKMQMDFVKKAEQRSAERAAQHKSHRRRDFTIAGVCFGLAASIYAYTIYAMKQEKFLDDFDLPDPMEMKDTSKPQYIGPAK